jgi:cell division protein FtsB
MKRRPSIDGAGSVPPRQRRRRRIESVLFGIGCLLLLDALIGERGVVTTWRASAAVEKQQQELVDAQAEGERLADELHRLTDDPATIEDVARRDLGLIKPGEKVFVITDIEKSDSGH